MFRNSNFKLKFIAATRAFSVNSIRSHIKRNGYHIVDDACINPDELLSEILELAQTSQHLLSKNQTILIQNKQQHLIQKPGIAEFDLENKSIELPACRRWSRELDGSAKCQINFGTGGCFPIHVDSDASNPQDGRSITAILYLNDCKSGELKLYPYPQEPVIVEPKRGRMVLFSSRFMHHRVLPCFEPRVCITTWISTVVSASLNQHAARMAKFKVEYADEWRQSILQSHSKGSILIIALEKDLARIRKSDINLGDEMGWL